ncbi:MAG: hypothetical protein IT175_05075 [Acidobacteria bacterium]|nr:hypothetical protein [Acidobacteriota bacterium]
MPRLRRFATLLLLPMLVSLLPISGVRAQQGSGMPLEPNRVPIVHRTDLYCAGVISKRQVSPEFYVVGGEKETEINWYTTSNVVYLNYGAKHGASVGESLYVVRPRGKYENPFTGKDLGWYIEEVGILRIISVQRNVSTARVETTCDTIRIGDLVRAYSGYVAATPREYAPLNRWDLPSGKLSGQIILSRWNRNYMSERDVIYIDIGDDKGVKLGQYYTIYRDPGIPEGPVGRGTRILRYDDDFPNRVDEYRDDRYRGTDFSSLRGKKREAEVVDERDGLPRKVVGEMVIIRVEDKAATGYITRVTQEVNIGDYVELQ